MEQEIKPMKPILFSTAMVRAILDGRKTVTRRLVKPQPEGRPTRMLSGSAYPGCFAIGGTNKVIRPPYQTGDILYVRETFYKDSARYMYKANYSNTEKFYRDGKEVSIKWRPSIHMPKEAARIFLRVKNVRVERLQNITDAGAMDEGAEGVACDCDGKFFCSRCCNTGFLTAPRDEFARIWGRTAPPRYGWEANPWVWVIEFERISKNEATEGGT